ncbi:MAG: hypothetical protein ABIQ31_14760 [Ferruginibacter sp.]
MNDEELEEAITDGPLDGEIDAIHIIGRIVHAFTFKYTDNFDKTTFNFPESELDQFTVTIQNLVTKNIIDNPVNDAILDTYLQILDLYDEGPLTFKFYIVSNKQKPVPSAILKFENAISQFRYTEVIYFDLEDLVKKLLEDRYPTSTIVSPRIKLSITSY